LLQKINWRVVLSTGVSILVIWLIFKDVNLKDLWTILLRGQYLWLLPGIVVMGVALWLRAMRWRVLLDKKLPMIRAYHILNAGNFLNNVLPLRLGEVSKAYLASRNSSITAMQALSTVFIERILDVLTMFLFLIAVLPLVPSQGLIIRAGQTAAGIAVAGIVILLTAAAFRERSVRVGRVLTRWLPSPIQSGLLRWTDEFLQGVSAASGWRLVIAVGWSLLIWLTWALISWVGMLIFIKDSTPVQAVFLMCSQALGLSIPSAPSGAGIYEGATIAGLAIFGVSKEIALAIGLTGHIFSFVYTAITGIIGLDREGEKFSHIVTAAQTALRAARK
jgi:uncharacterized protein (TIRG00374 family)